MYHIFQKTYLINLFNKVKREKIKSYCAQIKGVGVKIKSKSKPKKKPNLQISTENNTIGGGYKNYTTTLGVNQNEKTLSNIGS